MSWSYPPQAGLSSGFVFLQTSINVMVAAFRGPSHSYFLASYLILFLSTPFFSFLYPPGYEQTNYLSLQYPVASKAEPNTLSSEDAHLPLCVRPLFFLYPPR
jgi:hypothetical protein